MPLVIFYSASPGWYVIRHPPEPCRNVVRNHPAGGGAGGQKQGGYGSQRGNGRFHDGQYPPQSRLKHGRDKARAFLAFFEAEHNPDLLATSRDVSSAETIRAALLGNNRDEHIFALTPVAETSGTSRQRCSTKNRRRALDSEKPSEGQGTQVRATPELRHKASLTRADRRKDALDSRGGVSYGNMDEPLPTEEAENLVKIDEPETGRTR